MLIIIGTPLGNIEDISIRQIKVLFSLKVILAEDTRSYIKLRNILSERYPDVLSSLGMDGNHRPELISYREQNHNKILPSIIELLKSEKDVGLISDAGMPTISDPGQRLVEEVLRAGYEVSVVPGATAIESALSISGLSSDKFSFVGFLPRERGKIIKIINAYNNTVVFYESPFRLIKSLEIIADINSNLKVSASNDLTKKFEKTFRGEIGEVIEKLKKEKKIVGEWVVVIGQE